MGFLGFSSGEVQETGWSGIAKHPLTHLIVYIINLLDAYIYDNKEQK